MVLQKMIRSLTGSGNSFSDSYNYYRFQQDEDSNISILSQSYAGINLQLVLYV